jgi:Gametolysin peptidase M11.
MLICVCVCVCVVAYFFLYSHNGLSCIGLYSCHHVLPPVMFCLPYGSLRSGNPGWLGYAYIDHWKSVYNNVWCSSVSTLAHEVGHNLNLGHSGQGAEEYGDQVGYVSKKYCVVVFELSPC